MDFSKRNLPKKSEGLSDWYNKVVLEAQLADYGPAKGTMIFRPYGYGIWEQIQSILDSRFKARGVENAYFPLLIPESLINKEKEHVKGFSPELAVVTIGGGEELQERLVIRPTSETIMYHSFSQWIASWRDLPLLLNQWSNVVRWEKRTYLFLRTSEFLWQEGHTAHATHGEASAVVSWAMDTYEQVYRDFLAIPGYVGRKSESEKFAGADMTLSYESLMPEGKALQSSTSHDLGQNFARSFDIGFLDQAGERQLVWQTSWGLSTRSIGALLLTHGDDQGLRIPPRVAPIQVIIIPVRTDPAVVEYAHGLEQELRAADLRLRVDDRDNESLGSKINKWELRGVPLRLEVGPKEVENGTVTAIRRDTLEKSSIKRATVTSEALRVLDAIQDNMYRAAEAFLHENTHQVDTYEEFAKIMETNRGFILAPWCESAECEATIKAATKATVRCLPRDAETIQSVCIKCGNPAQHRWLFAQAY